MRALTGEGNPSLPDLLSGTFSGGAESSGPRSAMAIIAAARGKVSARDSRVSGGTVGSGGGSGPGGGGGGGGGSRPGPITPIYEL